MPHTHSNAFPFLSLHFRLGTMHVFCTNIVIWIRTLIKESLMEIDETEEEAHKHHGERGGDASEVRTTNETLLAISIWWRENVGVLRGGTATTRKVSHCLVGFYGAI